MPAFSILCRLAVLFAWGAACPWASASDHAAPKPVAVAEPAEAAPPKKPKAIAAPPSRDPLDVIRRREIAARIQTALDALPPYHRGVILMREVEGMSYEEMAQAMGVSKGTIMSRLFHARQKLQRALADCYAEEGGDRGRPSAAEEEAS